MDAAVLLLNADYTPMRIIPWERAISLLLAKRVYLVAGYAGKTLRSAHAITDWPAVVALKRYIRIADYKVRYNRRGVLARDRFICHYCGKSVLPEVVMRNGKVVADSRTIDHVIPKAQADADRNVTLPWNRKKVSVTSWENTVTACYACNNRKADRTPAQAGMSLLGLPRHPNPWDAVWLTLAASSNIPEEWRPFVPRPSWARSERNVAA